MRAWASSAHAWACRKTAEVRGLTVRCLRGPLSFEFFGRPCPGTPFRFVAGAAGTGLGFSEAFFSAGVDSPGFGSGSSSPTWLGVTWPD